MNLDIFDDDGFKAKVYGLEKKGLALSQSKEIRLPEWPDSKRGTPNSFLRSALFSTAADCTKERVQLKKAVLASQEGISIIYTGEQLNQENLTLWETLVHMAKAQHLECICDFTAYELLKAMNLQIGGDGYKRLEDNVMRLAATFVTISQGDKQFAGHLIDSVVIDKETHHYKIRLGRELNKLYSESTWIDVEQRSMLKKKSLAQYLHGYYSSHKTPYPVKVATLHQLSGSKIKESKKFKQNLKTALEELIKIDFLESYSIEGDLVTVKRK